MGGITQAQAALIGSGIGVVVLLVFWLWLWADTHDRLETWRMRRAARQPHHVEGRKRSRHPHGWALRCSRCGWLRDAEDRREALQVANEHHAVFGGSMIVRARRRWR